MRKSKIPKPTSARLAIASNIRHLMDGYQFGRGISSRGIQKAAGISYKTIDRMLDPYSDHRPNLDSLDEIASFFKVETWQLLQPHHGAARLNPPQKHSGITVKS